MSEASGAPRFARIGEILLDLVGDLPDKPVLQAPIDETSRMTLFLSHHLPFVAGVDPNMEAIELSGRILDRERRSNVVLTQGKLSNLHYASGQFGGVLCAEYLGHERQPESTLAELLRVCARGGYLVADFMAPQDSMRRLPCLVADGDGYVDPSTGRFFRFMDRMRLEGMLEKAGLRPGMFRISEVVWNGGLPGGIDDVLSRRHSFVVVAKKGGASLG